MSNPVRITGCLVAVILSCKLAPGAAIVSTTGTFTQDDNQVFFNFTLLTPDTITMQTFSFAGGTNVNGLVIPPGGFAPVLSLFSGTAPQNLLATDSGGTPPSGCGVRNIDPVTGFCLDAYLNLSLGVGSYILALTEFDNTPIGPTLADGFLQQGTGNFTGGPFFLNAGAGFQRNGNWAVDITNTAPPSAVPEPSTVAQIVFGLSIFALASAWRKRAA